jgi:hypothetical protein
MSLVDQDVRTLFDKLQSHAMRLGLFEQVNTHETKNPPGWGFTADIILDYMGPVPPGSGLAATSGLIVFYLRIYIDMLQEPLDMIDPNLGAAVSTLLSQYSSDFMLDDISSAVNDVRNIDLMGQTGRRLEAQTGYITVGGKLERVMTITIPIIMNDSWTQVS